MLVAVDDMVFGEELFPDGSSLLISAEPFFGTALEDCCIEVLGVYLQYINDIFPCPTDGFLLEVVAKGPVAEHLEHGVVVGVVAYLFEVVVLAADAEALLAVGLTA